MQQQIVPSIAVSGHGTCARSGGPLRYTPILPHNIRGVTMTKTFERFLRSFSDEELTRFAQERSGLNPPYWRVMSLALQIEADRRGLSFEADLPGSLVANDSEASARSVGA
jgi:hypothetical protein